MNQQSAFQQVLVAVVVGSLTVTTFAVIVIDELQGRPIDGTILSLLSFVMGMASTLLGTHIGGTLKAQGAQDVGEVVSATVNAGAVPSVIAAATNSMTSSSSSSSGSNHTTDGVTQP